MGMRSQGKQEQTTAFQPDLGRSGVDLLQTSVCGRCGVDWRSTQGRFLGTGVRFVCSRCISKLISLPPLADIARYATVTQSYRTFARHTLPKITPGDPGERRSCPTGADIFPNSVEQMLVELRSGPGPAHTGRKLWPMLANIGHHSARFDQTWSLSASPHHCSRQGGGQALGPREATVLATPQVVWYLPTRHAPPRLSNVSFAWNAVQETVVEDDWR